MPARLIRRLIVNADDFGLTRGINRAIAELCKAGVVTSATLMANGSAFEDAVNIARALPHLGVGCHIVLVDGRPILPPEEIPTLLGPGRKQFRSTLGSFVRDLLLHRIDPAEITREARAQVQKLQSAGVVVTHVDTHKHTHIFPKVLRALLRVEGLHAIRNPFEPGFSRRVSHPSLMRRLQVAALERFHSAFDHLTTNIATTAGTLGITATGILDAATLHRLVAALPVEGTYELCCHPGYNDADLAHVHTRLRAHRETEREALLAVIPKIFSLPQPPQLIHYGNLKQEPEAHP